MGCRQAKWWVNLLYHNNYPLNALRKLKSLKVDRITYNWRLDCKARQAHSGSVLLEHSTVLICTVKV